MTSKRLWMLGLGLPVAAVLAVAAGFSAHQRKWVQLACEQFSRCISLEEHGHSVAHDHDGHDAVAEEDGEEHQHETDRISLSSAARRNVGLRVAKLELTTFCRTITVPGMVVERPGRSDLQITAPLAGVVSRIYPIKGETVQAGDPLFDLRLTHEEVVQAQTELLRTIEELDVVRREVNRLDGIASGAIAHKEVLARKYEQQKLEGTQRAQVQALLLHGLTEEQVENIIETRCLLKVVTIHAPGQTELSAHSPASPSSSSRLFEMEDLNVSQGQHVQLGQLVCVLCDHGSLYVEGWAFEREAELLGKAVKEQWTVAVTFAPPAGTEEVRTELRFVYLSNKVDPESRTFRFYVDLPNEVSRDVVSPQGHRFIGWRFKPGQRVQVHVPVEQWPDRLVVPTDAVVQEGPEKFVFVQEGDAFERRPVQLEYQDSRSAILVPDVNLRAGDTIALSGAFQLQVALKNKSGGAVDPHAGHRH